MHHEIAGDGRAVVLIHGLGANADVWHAQRDGLAPWCRVITYDRGGCGRSPRPPGALSIDTWVEELRELLERLDIDRAVVIGHSLGSMVAQRFAARYPARTHALVLAGGEALLPDDARAVLTDRIAVIREEGLGAAVGPWLAGSLTAATRVGNPALVDRLTAMFLANDVDSYVEQAATLRDADVTGDQAGITCPTLILVGAQDPVTPVSWQRGIAAGIQGSRVRVIPDTAHMLMLEAPDAFNAAVLEFVSMAPSPEGSPGAAGGPTLGRWVP